MFDVIIVGGSVAGLSAALVLGRCKRRVLVCDSGKPRNRASRSMHGFLSRDGIDPAEFLATSRDQLAAYPTVSLLTGLVTEITGRSANFEVKVQGGQAYSARTILLATGIVDELPTIPGFEQFYGITIHHCPYCDGWEHRDKPIAVLGSGKAGVELALELLGWTADITFCTNGIPLTESERERLAGAGIGVKESAVEKLAGRGSNLARVHFTGGECIPVEAMFFSSPQRQHNDLARQLGCSLDEEGSICCKEGVCTGTDGVYAAGNTTTGLQLAIVAASEGAKAAWAINQALLSNASKPSPEDLAAVSS